MGSFKSPLSWIAIIIFLGLMLLPLIVPRQFSVSYLLEHEQKEEQVDQIYKGLIEE